MVDVHELRQRVVDLVDIVGGDAVVLEQLAEVGLGGHRDDVFLEAVAAAGARIALGNVGDVLRHDAHAQRRIGAVDAVAAAGRIVGLGVAQRDGVGDLGDRRTRYGAHDLLDLRRLQGGARIEIGRIDGEGADLDRHLAVDIGAVELIGGAGDRAAGGRLGGSGAEVSAKMRMGS